MEGTETNEIITHIEAVFKKEIPPFVSEDFFGTVPRGLFDLFAEQGLTGFTISESYGGLGYGPVLSEQMMETIASINLGPAIFLSVHLMVSGLIERHGSNDHKKQYLTRLSSGELLGAFALTEPQAGSDAAALRTEARLDGDFFILNGEKCYITSAGWADLYIVFARTPGSSHRDGINAFIVDAASEGLSISKPEKKMGCELSPIASVSFANCRVPKSNVLGEFEKGYRVALSGLNGGRVSIAACANGLSRSAIEKAISHLRERRQFGSPLADFQGLQFMLADMQMLLSAAQLLVRDAANELEVAGPSAGNLRPSMAKCFATDAAMKITTDAVQLLGGAGYIREYGVESLMRDAKMLQIVEGTNQIQRMVISRALLQS